MKKINKALLFVLVLFFIVLVVLGIYWSMGRNISPQKITPVPDVITQDQDRGDSPLACTEEAKLCPDGSYVGRDGPNCEFAECPSPVVNNPPPATVENTAKSYFVDISGFVFAPNTLTINKGDTVTWTNKDSAPHTVFGSGLSSATLGKNQSFTFTFNSAGTYSYICSIHPSMKGVIVVQ